MQNDHKDMKDCIELCWQCRHECQDTLFNHCLQEGGSHVWPDHVKLMTDCIQICQTAADFMTRQSEMRAETCRACAEICEACAESCEYVGGGEMVRCAEICRRCANSCREMGGFAVTTEGRSYGMHSGI